MPWESTGRAYWVTWARNLPLLLPKVPCSASLRLPFLPASASQRNLQDDLWLLKSLMCVRNILQTKWRLGESKKKVTKLMCWDFSYCCTTLYYHIILTLLRCQRGREDWNQWGTGWQIWWGSKASQEVAIISSSHLTGFVWSCQICCSRKCTEGPWALQESPVCTQGPQD